MDGSNRILGFCYDAAGNLLGQSACPSYQYTYDTENRMKSGGGVTYTYDGESKRVQKSTGKLYWYGVGGDVLVESDAAGNTTDEFIFFVGKRTARRDNSGNVFYSFGDHLGTSRVIVLAGQTTPCYDADYYPLGGNVSCTPLIQTLRASILRSVSNLTMASFSRRSITSGLLGFLA